MKKSKNKVLRKKIKKNKILANSSKKFLFFFEKMLLDLRIAKRMQGICLKNKIKDIKKEIAQLSNYSLIEKIN